ncbi:MAG: hypothetical protein GXO87_07585 [Chlorobi bacterium]|nr:hypothetical protein [Chlorobiota bacterium]
MELIYNITYFLIILVVLLAIVLFISFVLSRLRKEEDEYPGNMIAQRQPKMPRAIQVVPAKPRKIRSQDTQIYYLNKLRNTTNNYRQPATMGGSDAYYNSGTRSSGTNGVDYVERYNSNGNNKRYTIVNNQLRGAQGIVRDKNKFESDDDQVSFYGR